MAPDMTPEQWRRIMDLFHHALEMPAPGREEFVRGACLENSIDGPVVLEMLREHTRSGWLDRPLPLFEGNPVFAAAAIVSGRYRIERFIARGGMGEVYVAYDLELNERVALKTLLPDIANDARMLARFKQEIQLSRKIAHANVCRVFDLARHPADSSSTHSTVFLTMEFLEGETLAARLRREKRLPMREARGVLEQIAGGLDAAHRVGVLHRDLKPSNVMLAGRAVITDFGLARSFTPSGDTTATMTGALIGTPPYMAPEILSAQQATVASDLYALGLIAYEIVTGSLPFAAHPPLAAVILRAHAPIPAPRSLVPELGPAWERAILRALDRDPMRRFSSAGAFIRALAGEPSLVTLPVPPLTRRNVAAGSLGAALLIFCGGSWWAWKRRRDQPPAAAVNFYQKGIEDIHAGAYFAATKALEQAVTLAPKFSLAHARLAEAWNELDLTEKASEEMLLARRDNLSGISTPNRLQVEAIDLTITREFRAAAEKYEQMKRASDLGLDLDLGRAYEKAGQPDKAIASYRRAADGVSPNPAAWLRLAVLYTRQSKEAEADMAFQKAEQLYQITSNLEGLTELSLERGIAANDKRSLQDAARYLAKALETARAAGNAHQEINAELRIGTTAFLAGDSGKAEEYARHALETAQANQMGSLTVRVLTNLGSIYSRRRNFSNAEKSYQEALSLARSYNSPRLAALSSLSLAALHDQLDRPEDVVKEAGEALAFYQPNRFGVETLQCMTLLGRAESAQGNYDRAIGWFEKTVTAAGKSGDHLQMSLAHESLGDILYVEEKYPLALEHYRRGLELSTDAQHIGYAALHCGDVLSVLGEYEAADSMLVQADENAAKFPSLQLKIERTRAEAALSRNHFREAAARARHGLARNAGEDRILDAQLARILGLALLGSGDRRGGLAYCSQALQASLQLKEGQTIREARLAVCKARIEIGDEAGGRNMLAEIEPALTAYPESHWRALALMARADSKYVAAAQGALAALRTNWGDEAFRFYVSRPDTVKLKRPLDRVIFANR